MANQKEPSFQELSVLFEEKYNSKPSSFYKAPGRVNIIGEHIDYNGGLVFPMAIKNGIWALVNVRTDHKVRLASIGHQPECEIDLSESQIFEKSKSWANYPIGVLEFLKRNGFKLKGLDILFSGNLPDGSGLSSSAAIEVLTGYLALDQIEPEGWDTPKRRGSLAQLCQKVENEFIGVNCGIMDQFSIAVCEENKALMLDCETLKFEQIPLVLPGLKVVIMDSSKRRELAESKYNQRRKECDEAFALLNKEGKYKNLCQVSLSELELKVADPLLRKRARHAISEQERVKSAAEALKNGQFTKLGQLLNESHYSLAQDYEVTGFELDTLTQLARTHKACLGARMTGAGFGGCAVALVQEDQMENFKESISFDYQMQTGKIVKFYSTDAKKGVSRL